MDRRAKVELYEQIRREYEFGSGSIRAVARKFGVHRREVRQAIASATPPERKPVRRASFSLDAVKPFIESILAADKQAPRKQRHTAHRIYTRLCEEQPEYKIAESTVRRYVGVRKRELGLSGGEVHVPQSYAPAEEAQVDWYEAYADLSGERTKLYVFSMRSMNSGAAFHRAYRHATQQAFFEAHEAAFVYFGGVFGLLRYDNLASAVKRILRGYTREEHTRFVAFRSHWRFVSEFCTPEQPQEKGGVEGEAGYFRRNHLVPVPRASDLEALNALLLSYCREDERRIIADRQAPVAKLLQEEQKLLLPLPGEHFEIVEKLSCQVDKRGCVRCHTNLYSTPLRHATSVWVKVTPSHVEVLHEGKRVARHERSYGRAQEIYDLEHYLDVLLRKPGALARSRPLAQWRACGRWPQSFDRLWEKLIARNGRQAGTRTMVELLLLGREHGYDALRRGVEDALTLGCIDEAAVRCMMLWPASCSVPAPLKKQDLGNLCRYEREAPAVSGYDLLLGGAQ